MDACIHAYSTHAHSAHAYSTHASHMHTGAHTYACYTHMHVQAGSVVYPETGARRTLVIPGYVSYAEAVNAQIMGFVNSAVCTALEKR